MTSWALTRLMRSHGRIASDLLIGQESDFERLHTAAGAAFEMLEQGLRGSPVDAEVQVQSA